MARKRMIDPEFFLDEEVSRASALARLLYVGTWGIADDNFATFPNRPDWIKAQVFPYEEVDTRRLLDELSKLGKLVLFTADDGKEYWWIKNFFKYQRVDRPSKAKYPEYKGEIAEKESKLDEGSKSTRTEVKLSKEKRSKNTHTSTDVDDEYDDPRFAFFWKEYPKKVGKGAAWKSWKKIKNLTDAKARKICETLRLYKASKDWKKEDGKYVPNPATFLNQKRYDDEPQVGKLDTGAQADKYAHLEGHE